jgi:beta-glucosidase
MKLKPLYYFAWMLCLPWFLGGVAQSQNCGPTICSYLDPAQPAAKRAVDLVSRMTREEKLAQTMDHAPAIPRLGVAEYNWWNEGLHGVARSGVATVFPQAIALAATWDPEMVQNVADVISTEARARHNEAVSNSKFGRYTGLTYWSPNINIFRDPRWGRGQETYGEDPFLTATMGVAFVRGLQGYDPHYLKVVATPKHFAVHSGPEPGRHGFDVHPSAFDLADTYLPAFRAAIIQGGAASLMCAYNAVDGVPACASSFLLYETLRRDWGFNGFVVSDCDAVADVSSGHHYSKDTSQASAVSLKAGTDLDCGSAYKGLRPALDNRLITEADLDAALIRLFTGRMRLGMFDEPNIVPFSSLGKRDIDTPAHERLALQAARESIVLLRNQGVLPLPIGKRILVVGPTADLLQSVEGNYNGAASSPILPFEGISREFGKSNVAYAPGAPLAESAAMPVPSTYLHPQIHGMESGLAGEYFDNPNFSGAPALTRVDRVLNFDWDSVPPAPGLHGSKVSIRWSGSIEFPTAGKYTLSFRGLPRDLKVVDVTGEGSSSYTGGSPLLRIFLDGHLLVDSGTGVAEADVSIAGREEHAVRIELARMTNERIVAFQWITPPDALVSDALEKARQSDVIVAMVGLSPDLEGEQMSVRIPGFSGGDRTSIDLPDSQLLLLERLRSTGKPLIVVLQSGSAVAINWADKNADGVLAAWYGGEQAGTAIAETLSGKNNPSGKLPITFYRSLDDLPPLDNYSMSGRTYRYYQGKVLYPFGFGMSYANFKLSDISIAKPQLQSGETLSVSLTVCNESNVAGSEVVQVYLDPPSAARKTAPKLVGFQRVDLGAGQRKRISIEVGPREISHVEQNGNRVLSAGRYILHVANGQPRYSNQDHPISFVLAGSQVLPR